MKNEASIHFHAWSAHMKAHKKPKCEHHCTQGKPMPPRTEQNPSLLTIDYWLLDYCHCQLPIDKCFTHCSLHWSLLPTASCNIGRIGYLPSLPIYWIQQGTHRWIPPCCQSPVRWHLRTKLSVARVASAIEKARMTHTPLLPGPSRC